ncbi:lysoplasmalogenase family protein [Nocardioides yefusunii]|uniref:Lysoplasmalogenase family protein n=1 Tax=Nocardioides yefusunii TaxID=2500546 RepID=A0ABW1QZT4_9ACTN
MPNLAGLPSPVTWPFFVAASIHLLAQYAAWQGIAVADDVAELSKLVLLPALWLVLDAGLRHGARITGALPGWWRWAAAALAFSWLGDVVLTSEPLLLAGMGFFAVAHVAYVVTFLQAARGRSTQRPRWLVVPYLAWWGGLVVFALAGDVPVTFVVPALLYGTLLVAMAWLAARVSLAVGIGAALFVVSDSLIGLRVGDVTMPLHGVAVMATYLAAQALIVTGLIRAARDGSIRSSP